MIDVCCAIIVRADGAVLTAQRGADKQLPLKIEFPGGKMEPGESPEDCLIREIKEELNLDVTIVTRMKSNRHHYPEFSIHLIPFVCTIASGTMQLTAHEGCRWTKPGDLQGLDWAEADIPLVDNYLNSLK